MVNAAEADVEGPAVAAEDPDALLVQVILLREDLRAELAGAAGADIAAGSLGILCCLQSSGLWMQLSMLLMSSSSSLMSAAVAAWFFAPSS